MRHWKLVVAALVVVLLVAGGATVYVLANSLGETAAGDVRDGPATSPAATVTMADNTFQPASVTVPAGRPVEIELRNQGQASHNFTSDALRVSSGPMEAGDVKTISLTVPDGTTRFVCTFHEGMTIDVVGSAP